jgi:hypothetical protein
VIGRGSGTAVPRRAVELERAEAMDLLDPESRLGWSVVVTGIATHYVAYGQPEGGGDYNTTDMSESRLPVTDPARLARIDGRLQTGGDSVTDMAIAITPEIVTGLRLVAG